MLLLVLENTTAKREIDNKAISLKNLAGEGHLNAQGVVTIVTFDTMGHMTSASLALKPVSFWPPFWGLRLQIVDLILGELSFLFIVKSWYYGLFWGISILVAGGAVETAD